MKLANQGRTKNSKVADEQNKKLLASVAARHLAKRPFGLITTAKGYVQTILDCSAGLCPVSVGDRYDLIKNASQTLVYRNDEMKVIKSTKDVDAADTGGKPIMTLDLIATSIKQDRDGDILHPEGAVIDPMLPLLWQHNPIQPLGKMLKLISQDENDVRMSVGIADTVLGRDVVPLVEMGALRISQGFKPHKFKEVNKNGVQGFEVFEWDMLEVSLVSIPANTDAVVMQYSKGKLNSDAMKAFGKKLYERRPVIVSGGIGSKSADEEKPKNTVEEKETMDEELKKMIEEINKAASTINHCGEAGQAFAKVYKWTKAEADETVSTDNKVEADEAAKAAKGKKTKSDEVNNSSNTGDESQDTVNASSGDDAVEDTDPKEGDYVASVVWNCSKADITEESKSSDGTPYTTPDEIKAIFKSCKGVQDAMVVCEMTPMKGKGWYCAYPDAMKGDWADATKSDDDQVQPTDTEDTDIEKADNVDPVTEEQKAAKNGLVKKPVSCGCGGNKKNSEKKPESKPVKKLNTTKGNATKPNSAKSFDPAKTKLFLASGSAESISAEVELSAQAYLTASGVDYIWYIPVRCVAVYAGYVIIGVGVYDFYLSDSEQASARYFKVDYTLDTNGKAVLTGTPVEMIIKIEFLTKTDPATQPETQPTTEVGGQANTTPESAADDQTDTAAKSDEVDPTADASNKSTKVKSVSGVRVKKLNKKAVSIIKEADENLDAALEKDLKTPVKTLVLRASTLLKEMLDEEEKAEGNEIEDTEPKLDPKSDDSTEGDVEKEETKEIDDETDKSWPANVKNTWKALARTVRTSGSKSHAAISRLTEKFIRELDELEAESLVKYLSELDEVNVN